MSSKDLINDLTKDCAPVKCIAPLWVRVLKFLGAAFFCLLAGVSLVGLRGDIQMVARDPIFVLELVLMMVVVVTSAIAALLLSVPGERLRSWQKWLPLLPLGLWLGLLAFRTIDLVQDFGWQALHFGLGLACVGDIIAFGFLPGALLFWIIRRAAPINLFVVGFFGALAVAGVGALGSHLVCSAKDPVHLVLWHLLPLVLLGTLGLGLGRRLLHW